MRHGGITGFEVKIGQDSGISEPGTGPFLLDCEVYETVHELVASHCFLSKYDISRLYIINTWLAYLMILFLV
jgi:hypothetical protein